MELLKRIEQELKEAMREKNEDKRNALRLLLTAVKVKEKDSRPFPFRRAKRRPELAKKEEEEIKVLQGFLPEPLSAEELAKIVDEAVAEAGAQSAKDMGKVMKLLMPKVQGRAEGKQVNDHVRQRLQ